ncbi:MAG: NUDIX domain-containing protein [Candidatus Absconditabacteria bacterium]
MKKNTINRDDKPVIDLIDINENKEILLTNKKGTWILPGGKQEDGETDFDTLEREIAQELNGAEINPNSIIPYKMFEGITPFSKKQKEVIAYFGELITENLTASAEIMEARYEKNPSRLNLSPITKDIIETLIADGYLHRIY